MNLATAHFKLGNYSAAMDCAEQAITIEPSYSKAFYRKGRILTALGKPMEAQMNFEKALELHPDDPQILCSLSKVRSDHVFYRVCAGPGTHVEAHSDLSPRHSPSDAAEASSVFEFLSLVEKPAPVRYADGQLVEVFEVRSCK